MGTSMLRGGCTPRNMTAVALAGALVVTAACGAEGDRPGWKFLPGMMESVPHDTFEANPASEAGGMLLPPEGTVPVTGVPFLHGNTEEEAVRAGLELMNPLVATPEILARGKHRFETACLVCHGAGGEGDGPIIGRFPNPASLTSEHAKSYTDGRLYHVITVGQGIMPPHALQVLPEERWEVVLYLRQLQGLLDSSGAASPEAEIESTPVETVATPETVGDAR